MKHSAHDETGTIETHEFHTRLHREAYDKLYHDKECYFCHAPVIQEKSGDACAHCKCENVTWIMGYRVGENQPIPEGR